MTEAVPFDTLQSHLVEEPLIPYQASLEVVGAAPPSCIQTGLANWKVMFLAGSTVVTSWTSQCPIQKFRPILAEAGGFAGRRAVVQGGAGQDERAAGDDAGEGQGLAAETKQQRHHQHREVQDGVAGGWRPLRPRAGRPPGRATCLPARELGGPVAGPQEASRNASDGVSEVKYPHT